MQCFDIEVKKLLESIPYYQENEFDHKLQPNSNVYLYGAGFLGQKFADMLLKHGCKLAGFIETNVLKKVDPYHNLPIQAPDNYHGSTIVISSFKYYTDMQKKLIELGNDEKSIISPLAIFEKFVIPSFQSAYDAFDDDLSKLTVLDKIRFLIFNAPMRPVSAYFSCELFHSFAENEVFIDGGAYDGETSKEFSRIVNGKYKKIYCYEPTVSNYELAVQNLKEMDHVEIVNIGLYSKSTILRFKDFGSDQWNAVEDFFMGHEWNGPAMDYAIVEVPVVSLDDFFKDIPVEDWPTIIKLDIEGSEREALLGMRNVICTKHPKLIICAYHKIEDFYELANTIKEICPGYTLKLRHYTDTVLESIIFGGYSE